ncbi:MAG: hypothetical protein Gaeavirus8_11 [Gaeavirus sp.]|uniref:Thioredoxin domain-containing protein n=1 Tax=Gaeavirus sp. TaxID=2487767 RepID=A0A3G4ZYZ5_9VIRU|nr:MAG: hypothetical protein Gaeavirus8_11 [Gaeavirus sp.]
MPDKVTIILAKSKGCPHCTHFTPIFDAASEKIKSNSDLKETDIKFESYELSDEQISKQFNDDHPGLLDNLQGYPTVYMEVKRGNNIRTDFISHTVSENGNDKKAVNEFINNIVNQYKTSTSDKKDIYMSSDDRMNPRMQRMDLPQLGGSPDLTNDIYKHKYQKYKLKYYLEKQKSMNNH